MKIYKYLYIFKRRMDVSNFVDIRHISLLENNIADLLPQAFTEFDQFYNKNVLMYDDNVSENIAQNAQMTTNLIHLNLNTLESYYNDLPDILIYELGPHYSLIFGYDIVNNSDYLKKILSKGTANTLQNNIDQIKYYLIDKFSHQLVNFYRDYYTNNGNTDLASFEMDKLLRDFKYDLKNLGDMFEVDIISEIKLKVEPIVESPEYYQEMEHKIVDGLNSVIENFNIYNMITGYVPDTNVPIKNYENLKNIINELLRYSFNLDIFAEYIISYCNIMIIQLIDIYLLKLFNREYLIDNDQTITVIKYVYDEKRGIAAEQTVRHIGYIGSLFQLEKCTGTPGECVSFFQNAQIVKSLERLKMSSYIDYDWETGTDRDKIVKSKMKLMDRFISTIYTDDFITEYSKFVANLK